jgi:hypothetical protein
MSQRDNFFIMDLDLSQEDRLNMLARRQGRQPWRRVVRARGEGRCGHEPATTSLCPFRYFVAECITMSAPKANGRVRTCDIWYPRHTDG